MTMFARRRMALAVSLASVMLVTAATLVPAVATVSAAGATQSATDPVSGITATTPATYGFGYPNCSQAGPDAVTFTNVRPQDSLGPGAITVSVILANGSAQVVGTTAVNYNGTAGSTVSFPITYPAWSSIPTLPGGTKEVHVDISVPVYVNGVTQPFETFDGGPPFIGPLDWDVFCNGNPPSAACTAPGSITSNFNGTAIGSNATVWFSSVFKLTSPVTQPTTITISNGQVSYVLNNQTYTNATPNAVINLVPGATSASTTFSNGTFTTTVPTSFSGNAFLDGFQLPLPNGLPGGVSNVTWSATFGFSQPNVALNWQWAAAAYSQFSTDYNTLGVKPVDDNQLSQFKNSDHAGTPENFKTFVVGGARGGGGSNFTGSLSGTGSVKCA